MERDERLDEVIQESGRTGFPLSGVSQQDILLLVYRDPYGPAPAERPALRVVRDT